MLKSAKLEASNSSSNLSSGANNNEASAKQRSNEIDAMLKEAARQMRRDQKAVTMLLLGQSGAGKSTILRQFRINYAAKEFAEERMEWRPIIYLQVIKYVRKLLALLESDSKVLSPEAEKKLRMTKYKVAPLLEFENNLRNAIASSSTNADFIATTPKVPDGDGQAKEDVVLFNGWQEKLRTRPFGKGYSGPASPGIPQASNLTPGIKEDVETAQIMTGCKADIKALFDEVVSRNIEHLAEGLHFLKNVDRICQPSYIPSEEDILFSRVRTVGITETKFKDGQSQQFRIIDTGGSKSQRHSWVPFFDQASALIFLAPVSAFDEQLKEDNETNSLQDSLELFRTVLKNSLLKNISVILFLNKVDLLQKKLVNGIQFSQYQPNYTGPNELRPILEWVKSQFYEIFQKTTSAQSRGFYPYNTTATDTKATQKTLTAVKDAILATHLVRAGIINA